MSSTDTGRHRHTVHVYITLLELILTCNAFGLNSKYYLPIHETNMETHFAPTNGSLFMIHLDKNYLSNSIHKPHTYLRYIAEFYYIGARSPTFQPLQDST